MIYTVETGDSWETSVLLACYKDEVKALEHGAKEGYKKGLHVYVNQWRTNGKTSDTGDCIWTDEERFK